jgi:hypothetical protein
MSGYPTYRELQRRSGVRRFLANARRGSFLFDSIALVFNYSGGHTNRSTVIGQVAKDNGVCSDSYIISNFNLVYDLGAGANADLISDLRSTQCHAGMDHYVITDYAIRVHYGSQSIVRKMNISSHPCLVWQKTAKKDSWNLLQHER